MNRNTLPTIALSSATKMRGIYVGPENPDSKFPLKHRLYPRAGPFFIITTPKCAQAIMKGTDMTDGISIFAN